MAGDGGSILDGMVAGKTLLKTGHLRKDPNEVRGGLPLSECEYCNGSLFLPRAELTMKESCVVLVPVVPESGRGLSTRLESSQQPLVCHPGLMKLCLKLPNILFGWRQCSQGTVESQLE